MNGHNWHQAFYFLHQNLPEPINWNRVEMCKMIGSPWKKEAFHSYAVRWISCKNRQSTLLATQTHVWQTCPDSRLTLDLETPIIVVNRTGRCGLTACWLLIGGNILPPKYRDLLEMSWGSVQRRKRTWTFRCDETLNKADVRSMYSKPSQTPFSLFNNFLHHQKQPPKCGLIKEASCLMTEFIFTDIYGKVSQSGFKRGLFFCHRFTWKEIEGKEKVIIKEDLSFIRIPTVSQTKFIYKRNKKSYHWFPLTVTLCRTLIIAHKLSCLYAPACVIFAFLPVHSSSFFRVFFFKK